LTIRRACTVAAVALAFALMSASAASASIVGAGARPGLTVDAAGTAYVAWNGPESTNSTLRFCRLRRGATACDAGVGVVLPAPATTTSVYRPFVIVSGDHVVVVQFRYPTSGSLPAGLYRFNSTNRGATFAAPVVVGSVAFEEAVAGPSDTLSGVPLNSSMFFQNVVLSGSAPVNSDGSSAVGRAELSTTHLNYASVGLIDAATPLAMFTNGDDAQFRRYNGGDLNAIASWGPPTGIGFASYPKLAGGPSGLFVLAGDVNGVLFARKWNGSTFGAPAAIGPGSTPSKHLFQDAAGRLHAVFQRDSANPLQIVHAVSDDGLTWRSGTVVKQDIATAGGISDLRVATAPDHVGVVVWHADAANDIRVVPVGPDAPGGTPTTTTTTTPTNATPPPADLVSFRTAPKSLRVSNAGRFTYNFRATPRRSGKVGLSSTKKVKIGSKKRRMKLAAKTFTSLATSKVSVRFKLSKKNLKALKRTRKIAFKVTATLTGRHFTTKLTLKAPKQH
jgi:hypothetical protein